MKQHLPLYLLAFILSACSSARTPQAVQQDEASAQATAMQRCTRPVSPQPTWWHDGATGDHFGCASAHNAAVQDLPPAPAAAGGTDGIIAVSGVLRYRKGKDKPLREPSLDPGTPAREAR